MNIFELTQVSENKYDNNTVNDFGRIGRIEPLFPNLLPFYIKASYF